MLQQRAAGKQNRTLATGKPCCAACDAKRCLDCCSFLCCRDVSSEVKTPVDWMPMPFTFEAGEIAHGLPASSHLLHAASSCPGFRCCCKLSRALALPIDILP